VEAVGPHLISVSEGTAREERVVARMRECSPSLERSSGMSPGRPAAFPPLSQRDRHFYERAHGYQSEGCHQHAPFRHVHRDEHDRPDEVDGEPREHAAPLRRIPHDRLPRVIKTTPHGLSIDAVDAPEQAVQCPQRCVRLPAPWGVVDA
jgi:hypothetical protein